MCAGCANKALTDRLESLVAELLPGGRRESRLWRCGDLGGAGGKSLAVELAGHRRGRWKDFADAGGIAGQGDALDLVRWTPATGCDGDLDRAMVWAHRFLRQPLRELPPPLRRTDRPPPTPEDTRRSLGKIWREAPPLTRGDLAWRYLVETRGITGLEALGPLPALRFHPELWNAQLRTRLPALVAAIADADGCFAALHRTFLSLRNGQVVKAPIGKELGGPKRTLGYYRGGCTPVWAGKSGRSWRDPEPGEPLGLCEGLEDALTLAVNRPALRVAAAISLSNMVAMRLPDNIRDVLICAQNDAAGSPAARTLERAIRHFSDDLQRSVCLLRPPAGIKDVNDLQCQVGRRE
jgi:hypothetical protein